jgi:hypothetical protein
VYGYRLRALQHYRERLIGSVKINLSVLAQSSPYIADVAPAPSISRKSFAARMSMSESFSQREAAEAIGAPPAGGTAGGPKGAMILANHCAWFTVDCKRKRIDAAGTTTSSTATATGRSISKDNSVVRLLSSENVRMDVQDTQLRIGIKMIKNNA